MHPLTPEQAKLLLQAAHEAEDRLEALYITLDTYSHVLPNMHDQAAAAMEEALS
jgi:hypothetical protein